MKIEVDVRFNLLWIGRRVVKVYISRKEDLRGQKICEDRRFARIEVL